MTTNLDPCLSRNGHLLRETERLAAAMRAVESVGLCVAPSSPLDNENWIAYPNQIRRGHHVGRGTDPAAAVEDWLRRNPEPEDQP